MVAAATEERIKSGALVEKAVSSLIEKVALTKQAAGDAAWAVATGLDMKIADNPPKEKVSLLTSLTLQYSAGVTRMLSIVDGRSDVRALSRGIA